MTHPTNPDAVKVKRDGPRGWHWVVGYDADAHELYVDAGKGQPVSEAFASFDHDGDGKPGGSLPKAKRKGKAK